jgi:hypothetical protein
LRLTADGFGIEPEITARLAQWGARIYEVPISYHGRSYDEGKHIGWRDGLQALGLMFKFRFVDTVFVADRDQLSRQNLVRGKGLRRWLLAEFGDQLGARVLEIMPGPGVTTSLLLNRPRLVLAEQESVHLETLQRRYGHLENIEFFPGINQDLIVACEKAEIDTVICFDGLQRSDHPGDMLGRLADCLPAGGRLLLHVPQDPDIFGELDRKLGHTQRFTRRSLAAAVDEAGLELQWLRDFNRLGRFVWRRRRREAISAIESRLIALSLPLARFIDRLGVGRGLSLLAVASKPSSRPITR